MEPGTVDPVASQEAVRDRCAWLASSAAGGPCLYRTPA